MIPFYEPCVKLQDDKQIAKFDKIAKRLGLQGLVFIGRNYDKKSSEKRKQIEYISRLDISEDKVENVRKKLPQIRKQCELLSISTSSPKVAQWVVKDNRVDILSIPFEKMREIITEQLANVASQNRTFIEIDLSSIVKEEKSKSFSIRTLSRIMNLIIRKHTPYIFTMNPTYPIDLRDSRAVMAIANLLGVKENWIKESLKEFNNRIVDNRSKLSDGFIAPGISQSKKKSTKNKISKSSDEIIFDIPENLQELEIDKKKLERQRYILFEILSEKSVKITKKEIEEVIWKQYAELYGSVGSSRAGLYFTYFNEKDNFGILRCNHKTLKSTRSVLAIISAIKSINAQIHIMKVSGTIQNLRAIVKKKEK